MYQVGDYCKVIIKPSPSVCGQFSGHVGKVITVIEGLKWLLLRFETPNTYGSFEEPYWFREVELAKQREPDWRI